MSPRRLLALVLAAIWLLPIAVAGGVALHVGLDHDLRHGHGGAEPLGVEHRNLPQLLFHGHLHGDDESAHEHAVAPVLEAGIRSPRFAAAPLPTSTLAFAWGAGTPGLAVREAPPTPPPPRHAGSARLAALSTLRI